MSTWKVGVDLLKTLKFLYCWERKGIHMPLALVTSGVEWLMRLKVKEKEGWFDLVYHFYGYTSLFPFSFVILGCEMSIFWKLDNHSLRSLLVQVVCELAWLQCSDDGM
ncbi:hypothetical protein VNO78_32562 [Psophocarpus tetragonolobus]|uniref:Uncharacterized protein n=1 Tax=Psophocarpus tetragonolobus TaxID=3891 RepID=A0AAN9NVI6_PSOTE